MTHPHGLVENKNRRCSADAGHCGNGEQLRCIAGFPHTIEFRKKIPQDTGGGKHDKGQIEGGYPILRREFCKICDGCNSDDNEQEIDDTHIFNFSQMI